MGDTVKKILITAAVVTVSVLTMNPGFTLTLPALLGGATLAGFAAAATAGLIMGAVGGLLSFFSPQPKLSLDDVVSRLNVSLNPQAEAWYVFGQTAFPTDMQYRELFGAQDDRECWIVAHAAHEVESIDQLHINDEAISFTGDSGQGAWANTVWWRPRLGQPGQTHIGSSFAGGTIAWPTSAVGENVAYSALGWRYGQDKTKQGLPTRLTFAGKGAKMYDPRLDTTRGGSGTHRTNDKTTWQYTAGAADIGCNFALVLLRYLLGEYTAGGALLWGRGADPDTEFDWDNWMAMANVCEQIVDSKWRYQIGGAIKLTGDHETIIGQLLDQVGAKLMKPGGKYQLWVPHDDLTPFSSITDADILRDAGVEYIPSAPLEEIFNTGIGRYVDPAQLYQPVPYPEVQEAAAVTEDQGVVRTLPQDYAFIQDVEIAQRVTRYKIRRSRFSGGWKMALGPKGLLFKPYTVTTLNCVETNNQDQTVRIVPMEYGRMGVVAVEAIEEDSSIYDTTAALGTPVTQQDPAAWDPTATVAVTNLLSQDISLNGDSGSVSDALKITWDDPGGLIVTTEVQYKIAAEADYQSVNPARIGFTHAIITPVEVLTLYDIRARHITLFGAEGAWSDIQDVTGDTYITPLLAQAIADAATAQGTADGKVTTFYQASVPTAEGVGDLWIDPDDGDKLSRWSGTAWEDVQDDDITTAILDAADAQATADSKIISFYQESAPTAEGIGDLWTKNSTRQVYRWSGSSWEAQTPANVEDSADVTETRIADLINPSFEAGDTGWVKGTNAAIINDPTNARRGSYVLRVNDTSGGYIAESYNNKIIPVEPGDRLLFQAHFKRDGTSDGACLARIRWRNSVGATISVSDGSNITSTTYSQSRVIGVAPATAVEAHLQFRMADQTTGNLYADDAYAAIFPKDSDIDSLQTVNGPAQAGADVTGDRLEGFSQQLLPNWNFSIADSTDKPAGLRGVEGVTDRSQIAFGGIGIVITTTPDSTVAYGFPAIPIDEQQQYRVTVRHRSSGASASGLILRFNELNTSLQSGKTHIGLGGESVISTRSGFIDIYSGSMPGVTTTENTYTYTPTAGTKFATFTMYNWVSGVDHEVEFVQMDIIPKTADNITETTGRKWAGDTGAIRGGLSNIILVGYGDFERIPIGDNSFVSKSSGTSTVNVQAENPLSGLRAVKLTNGGSAGSAACYFAENANDYNIPITPNRRWIAAYSVRTNTSTAHTWNCNLRTSAAGAFIGGVAIAAGAINTYKRMAFEIDLTADNSTRCIFRPVSSGAFPANAIAYFDLCGLYDVTDHPNLTADNFPTEHYQAGGPTPANLLPEIAAAQATADSKTQVTEDAVFTSSATAIGTASLVTFQTLNVTVVGSNPVIIQASAQFKRTIQNGTKLYAVDIFRDSTALTIDSLEVPAGEGITWSRIHEDNPGAGSYTYTLQARSDVTGGINATNKFLSYKENI